MGDSQDTKPADSARRARVQEISGAPVDDPVTPGPLRLQATTGTQTDETTPPQIETLEENEAPEVPEKDSNPRANTAQEQRNTM